jgi:hypothetical protein
MKIHYDAELLENGRTIELISIALVADDGREYYAVNQDMPQIEIALHDWLMANVVPSLPTTGVKPIPGSSNPLGLDWTSSLIKPHRVIAEEVSRFIFNAPDPELWAWYGAYDHVVLSQLWGRMIDHPPWVPMWTNDLKTEWLRLGKPEMPEQTDGHHNALQDARHNKVMSDFLVSRERQEVFLDLHGPLSDAEFLDLAAQLSPEARAWLGFPRILNKLEGDES